ncbi:MAG: DinB family protein [Candidatus Acidiferrales bacterium]
MTPGERERAINALHESRGRLLATVQRLSPSQLAYKMAADRWSVAECVEHIILVENSILRGIEKTVQQPADSPQTVVEDDALVARVVDRNERMNGPERLMPTGRWPHHELCREFESVRKRTSEFAATTGASLRESGFPHPAFGPLDCYQWLLLIAAHGERHRAQAEEVMASAGFPRAASAS